MNIETKVLYRYRPVDILKEKSVIDELANREIFLGSLKENNDPMDGLLDAYWKGDEVIWTSFIKHYCLCLLQSFSYVLFAKNSTSFSSSHINARATTEILSEEGKALLNCFISKALEKSEITKLIKALSKNGAIHRNELHAYLLACHGFFIKSLREAEVATLGTESIFLSEHYLKQNFSVNPEQLDVLLQIKDPLNSEVRHQLSDISIAVYEELATITRYNHHYKKDEKYKVYKTNIINILINFPSLYIKSVLDSAHDEYYLASFSEKNDHLTMWGHYAQGHRGICMIFQFEKDEHGYYLEANNQEKLRLHKVEYNDEPPRINIFETLGYLTKSHLYKYWLINNSNTSELSTCYDNSYHQKYWHGFHKKVSHKFTPWKEECEHRIIRVGNYPKNKRIINYKPKHLAGIIFGFQTEEDIKFKILSHLDEKLDSESKKLFKFYQARYTASTKKLSIMPLSLLKFS